MIRKREGHKNLMGLARQYRTGLDQTGLGFIDSDLDA